MKKMVLVTSVMHGFNYSYIMEDMGRASSGKTFASCEIVGVSDSLGKFNKLYLDDQGETKPNNSCKPLFGKDPNKVFGKKGRRKW